MHDTPITPELQAAWDNYQLALALHHQRDLPFDVSADGTHAIGVAIESQPEPCSRLVFLARPARPSLREWSRDIFADLKRALDHPHPSSLGRSRAWL